MMISIEFDRFGEGIKLDLSYQKRQLEKSYLIGANVGFDKAKYAALYLLQLTV
jgi:hypothetical protein